MARTGKALWILVVMAVSVALVTMTGSSARKYEGQVITVLGADHPGFNCVISLAQDFEKVYGAKVKFDQVDAEAIWTKVMLTAGTGNYDVLMVDSMQVPELIKVGVLEPLDTYMNDPAISFADFDLADVIPCYVELFRYNGSQYALPLSGETVLYFYRKDLYDKYGRKPAKTMKELMDDLAFFNGREPGLYGGTWRAADAYPVLVLMWHFGGRFFEGDDPHNKLIINSNENLAAWRFFRDAMKYAPPGAPSFGYDQSTSMFQQLKAAIYIDATNIQYLLDPSYSKLTNENMGWALVPLADGVTKREAPVCGWGLAVAKASKRKEAAFKFIEYQLTKANDKVLTKKGRMPNRISTCLDPELVALYPYLPTVLETLKYANPEFLPRIPESVEIWNLMSVAAREVSAGQKSPEKALEELQASIHEVLENAGYYKK